VVKSCIGGWCTVSAGCFTMGSPKDEACRFSNETAHKVDISRDITMARTETSQQSFQDLMGYAPAYFKSCNRCPVEQVTWHEAAAYCNALSTREKIQKSCYSCTGTPPNVTCKVGPEWTTQGMKKIVDCPGFRLPTEAEFEYAYRGGTTSHYYSGDLRTCTGKNPTLDSIAWYDQNSGKRTQKGAMKQANGWGLFDLGGNVWEWTNDWWKQDLGGARIIDPIGPRTGSNPVVRGGSWDTIAGDMRAAFRDRYTINKRYSTVGFRCVRTLWPKGK
jgi:formylglycine-generating enzyme required for sulfatase activity